MDYEEKREKLIELIDSMDLFPVNKEATLDMEFKILDRDISELCYSLSELNLLPDDVSISEQQFKLIVKAWYAIFERGGFPKELKM